MSISSHSSAAAADPYQQGSRSPGKGKMHEPIGYGRKERKRGGCLQHREDALIWLTAHHCPHCVVGAGGPEPGILCCQSPGVLCANPKGVC